MSSGLDKILQQAHAEGRHDSEGVFSVSLQKGLEKMARYTLERPSAWILKVAQAAVGLGATRLNGHVGKQWIELEFRFQEQRPAWTQIRDAIAQPGEEYPPALQDLAIGLWSLARGPERCFNLNALVERPEFARRHPSLRWRDGLLTVDDTDTDDTSCSEFKLYVNRPAAGFLSRVTQLFGGSGPFLEELDELRQRAYLLPVDGYIDGILGHHFLRAQTAVKGVARGRAAYPNPFLWGWNDCPELPELGLHPRWEEYARHIQLGADFQPAQKWLSMDFWGSKPSAMWALCFDFASLGSQRPCERSEIRWIQHGVVVDQTPLPMPAEVTMGVVLHLSAQGLPSDLGGMRLVAGDAFAERRDAGLRELKRHLDPQQLHDQIFGWDLPEQALLACLKQAELLASTLP